MAEIVILGSAQDGGVPHAGCLCTNCQVARSDPAMRRRPAALGVRSNDNWLLIDATQAFEEQMHMLWSRRPASASHREERYQPPDALLLTHAHTGHYTGLWNLDKSVLAAGQVPVFAPPRTTAMLGDNEPWATMERDGYLALKPIQWNQPILLIDGLRLVPIEVPHRSEWPTDTAAFVIEGPSAGAIYLSDIDYWDEWDQDLVDVVGGVDIAILDGSFWEAPTSAGVPHPPIRETMDRLQQIADEGRTRIIFTHLNHSNPVASVGSREYREVLERGYEVAFDGLVIEV